MNEKIIPCLWFDGQAEEAAEFYTSLLPDSRVERVTRSPVDYPAGAEGNVLTVDFTLAGRRYLALNAGPEVTFNEGVSFQIMCDDQAEVDRLWDRIAEGGEPIECGWIRDRYGLPWQIVPRRLIELINHEDRVLAARVMTAMMGMNKMDIATLEQAARSGG